MTVLGSVKENLTKFRLSRNDHYLDKAEQLLDTLLTPTAEELTATMPPNLPTDPIYDSKVASRPRLRLIDNSRQSFRTFGVGKGMGE